MGVFCRGNNNNSQSGPSVSDRLRVTRCERTEAPAAAVSDRDASAGRRPSPCVRDGRNTPAHEVYDPAANRWTALAYVPTARDHLAVAAVSGRLYAVGGRIDGNYSRNLASNEVYDPATSRWEQRAPMPTARSGIAAAVLEGQMFVFGGEGPFTSSRADRRRVTRFPRPMRFSCRKLRVPTGATHPIPLTISARPKPAETPAPVQCHSYFPGPWRLALNLSRYSR
jgi:hypothetical protein